LLDIRDALVTPPANPGVDPLSAIETIRRVAKLR